MIIKIDKKGSELLFSFLESHKIGCEIISEHDLNPYEYLAQAIIEERDISMELKNELFEKIVDATDEIGYEMSN